MHTYGGCDIYVTKLEGERWTKSYNLGGVFNSVSWDSQPSISADGRTIYFSSARSGGFGGMDIYKSTLKAEGTWGKPENLGPTINTKGDEDSPFLHLDDQTLYFATNGLPGLGGKDLYVSRLTPEGTWGKPENLGYPINTNSEDASIFITADGKTAFLSSAREENIGVIDIYSFELYEKARPKPVSYFQGTVYDNDTKLSLASKVELIDLTTKKVVIEVESNKQTGEFLVCLPSGKNYALNVSKNKYMFHSEHFEMINASVVNPYTKDVFLKPIKENQKVVLKNVFSRSIVSSGLRRCIEPNLLVSLNRNSVLS
jgi:hypothetical protein